MAVQVSPIVWRAHVTSQAQVSSPVVPALTARATVGILGQPALSVSSQALIRVSLYFSINNGVKSQRISTITQSMELQNLIELWEIDLTHLQMGIIRFAPDVSGSLQPIRFGGNIYYPWPIAAEGMERSAQGSAARPTLRAGAVTPEMTSLLIGADGLQGSKVTRIRTFRRFLDDGEEPSVTDTFPLDMYRIELVKEWVSGVGVTIELASPLDMENCLFPRRQIIRDYCLWRYRSWDFELQKYVYASIGPCPYTGDKSYDLTNQPTQSHLDVCSKTVAGCKARFGDTAILPYGGFPGVATNSR